MVSSPMPLAQWPPTRRHNAASKLVWMPPQKKIDAEWQTHLSENKQDPIDTDYGNSIDVLKNWLDTHSIEFPDLTAAELSKEALPAPVPTHIFRVLLHLLIGVLLHVQIGAPLAERSLTPVAQRSLTRVTAERSLTPFPSWLGTWAQGCKWPVL